eukprot:Lankesteria_metandrocarpae@DN5290_c2_g1_i1.p1
MKHRQRKKRIQNRQVAVVTNHGDTRHARTDTHAGEQDTVDASSSESSDNNAGADGTTQGLRLANDIEGVIADIVRPHSMIDSMSMVRSSDLHRGRHPFITDVRDSSDTGPDHNDQDIDGDRDIDYDDDDSASVDTDCKRRVKSAPAKSIGAAGDFEDDDTRQSNVAESEQDYTESDDEGVRDYKEGGYHPVSVGEIYNSRYRVEGKLGWGHFSTVWIATDLKNSPLKYVAIKFQKSAKHYYEAALDEIELLECAQRRTTEPIWLKQLSMYREALATQSPIGNGVVDLLDSFEHIGPNGKHVCMVFEVMGPNLLSLIKKYNFQGVPLNMVRRIACHILVGLDYLHRVCHIIHTDVKPENILVSCPRIPAPRPHAPLPTDQVAHKLTDKRRTDLKAVNGFSSDFNLERNNDSANRPFYTLRELEDRHSATRDKEERRILRKKIQKRRAKERRKAQAVTGHTENAQRTDGASDYHRQGSSHKDEYEDEDDLESAGNWTQASEPPTKLLSGSVVSADCSHHNEELTGKRNYSDSSLCDDDHLSIANSNINKPISVRDDLGDASYHGGDKLQHNSSRRPLQQVVTVIDDEEDMYPPYVKHELKPNASDPSLLTSYRNLPGEKDYLFIKPPYHYAAYRSMHPDEYVLSDESSVGAKNPPVTTFLPYTQYQRKSNTPLVTNTTDVAATTNEEEQNTRESPQEKDDCDGAHRRPQPLATTSDPVSENENTMTPTAAHALRPAFRKASSDASGHRVDATTNDNVVKGGSRAASTTNGVDKGRSAPQLGSTVPKSDNPTKSPTVVETSMGPFELKPSDHTVFHESWSQYQIVDLGNGCWVEKHFSDDIQTRQYRSPEVLVQWGYDASADIWSFACMIFELATGDYLFEPKATKEYSRSEDHVALIMELLGTFPTPLIQNGKKSSSFFDARGGLKNISDLKYWGLQEVLEEKYNFSKKESASFASFLLPMLSLNPMSRATACQMLRHPWLSETSEEVTSRATAAAEVDSTTSPLTKSSAVSGEELLRASDSDEEADDDVNLESSTPPSSKTADGASKYRRRGDSCDNAKVDYQQGNGKCKASASTEPSADSRLKDKMLSLMREQIEAAACNTTATTKSVPISSKRCFSPLPTSDFGTTTDGADAVVQATLYDDSTASLSVEHDSKQVSVQQEQPSRQQNDECSGDAARVAAVGTPVDSQPSLCHMTVPPFVVDDTVESDISDSANLSVMDGVKKSDEIEHRLLKENDSGGATIDRCRIDAYVRDNTPTTTNAFSSCPEKLYNDKLSAVTRSAVVATSVGAAKLECSGDSGPSIVGRLSSDYAETRTNIAGEDRVRHTSGGGGDEEDYDSSNDCSDSKTQERVSIVTYW